MSNKWPIFTGNNTQVNAVKISAIRQQDNGYGVITPEGGYPAVTVTDGFMRDWKPVVGGYLVQDATGQLVFMSAANFEAQYTPGGGGGDVTSADITDATTIGKQVLTAADQAAARTAIGAGTSNLALGTTASTALAGNGTAAAATKLATARTITLTGAVTGSASFDGTGNISIATTAGA
ncbi:hypothetical protein [Klebsiella aerogenes]|uniref:hypothetical protein n=1 Tax=Klebsiella aerogenes TaxID=548 RepID=UPI0013D0093D|nr:hypothetical protein [Klebsiella aerogenes]EKZ9923373.1 hypothetical protein [Klebsiella aerogenes]HDS4020825.1 hypothetical protein [Klebsiella aerogenes]